MSDCLKKCLLFGNSPVLSSMDDIEKACNEILSAILEIDAIDAGAIYFVDEESEVITLKTLGGLSPQKPQSDLTIEYHSILGEVIKKIENPIFSNVDSFPFEVPKRILYEKLKAIALIPVYHRKERIGIITIGSRSEHHFRESIQNFLETVSKTFGNTLVRILTNENKLQESGDLFKETIEQSFDGIMIMDLQGEILQCNRMQGMMHDLNSDEMIGMHIWDFFSLISSSTKNKHKDAQDFKKMVNEYTSVLKNTGSVIIEREFRKKDDSILTYEISYFPIHVSRKELVCSITRDITKQKKLDRMKDHFIHMISHETRTPVTSILHGIDLLNQDSFGSITEEQKNMLSICKNNANRLKEFLDEILHFQKLFEESISLNITSISAETILKSVIRGFKEETHQKHLSLALKIDGKIPFIEGDYEKLHYVLFSIISNAVQYTKSGSINARIQHNPNEKTVTIRIKDTGIGIKEEDLEHLFTAFSQIPSEENYHIPKSKGLGLASAKKIIELHGGSISVKSEYNKGSEFCIHLPIKYEKYYSQIKKS